MPAVLSSDHIVSTKKDAVPVRTAYNTMESVEYGVVDISIALCHRGQPLGIWVAGNGRRTRMEDSLSIEENWIERFRWIEVLHRDIGRGNDKERMTRSGGF